MNKHRLEREKLEDIYVQASDINKDGNVDLKDLLTVNKYRLNIIESI